MDDTQDPIHNFFTAEQASEENILYTTLALTPSATAEEIRKAYRKLALKHHPDKHASKTEAEKEEAGKEFQRIGFAYAVLSDEGKRKRYDSTGRTDESGFADAEEMGWEAYFETLFERIDRKVLDEDKAKYQGSEEEKSDLIDAYTSSAGSFPSILSSIPHSTHADEARFVTLINDLISAGSLESTKAWKKTSVDKTASLARGKKAAKEAKEAEQAAKDLGVWDEFYGSGAKGKRKGDDVEKGKKGKKGKGGKGKDDGGDDALALLIQKRQRSREEGFSALEEKYRKIEEERAGKRAKKGKKADQENEGPPDISDADFEALQAKMFGDKPKPSGSGSGSRGSKGKKSRS